MEEKKDKKGLGRGIEALLPDAKKSTPAQQRLKKRKDPYSGEYFIPKRTNQIYASRENQIAHNNYKNQQRKINRNDKNSLKNKELRDEVKELKVKVRKLTNQNKELDMRYYKQLQAQDSELSKIPKIEVEYSHDIPRLHNTIENLVDQIQMVQRHFLKEESEKKRLENQLKDLDNHIRDYKEQQEKFQESDKIIELTNEIRRVEKEKQTHFDKQKELWEVIDKQNIEMKNIKEQMLSSVNTFKEVIKNLVKLDLV